MMSTSFRKELYKFDVERVLVAWDGMMAKQQMALEVLAVPGMFVSSSSSDVEVSHAFFHHNSCWVADTFSHRTERRFHFAEAEKGHASTGRDRWWRVRERFMKFRQFAMLGSWKTLHSTTLKSMGSGINCNFSTLPLTATA